MTGALTRPLCIFCRFVAICALAGGFMLPGIAAEVTYFGLDASNADLTNANAARNALVATLDTFAEETMESISGQTDPVIFAGAPFQATTDFDYVVSFYAFSVSPDNTLLDQGPSSAQGPGFNDWIQFSQPITAFGSYFAQGGDGPANTLTLRLENTSLGTSKDVQVGTLGPGAPFLNIFFFGLTDTDPFDRVTMVESIDYDGMLLDNMIAGFVRPPLVESKWNVDAGGIWSAGENWSNGEPNGTGAVAQFIDAITAPRTITLDGPKTVGSLTFDNAATYTLDGPGRLRIDSSAQTSINVVRGSHTIQAPLSIAADQTVTKTGTGTITIGGNQSHDAGAVLEAAEGVTNLDSDPVGNLTLLANAQVNLRATQHLAGLQVDPKGAVQLSGVTAITLVTPSIKIENIGGQTGTLDITTNAAIIDFAGDSPVDSIRQHIIVGRGGVGLGKTWNGPGITSSAAAAAEPESRSLGYADNLALPLGPYTTFHGQSVDNTAVLIAFTRTGDANLDGVVNDDDVTIVSASYAPGVSQGSWALGDFDYSGFVDDDDVTLLGAFYDPAAMPLNDESASQAALHAATVPEPATLHAALIAAAAGVWTLRRTARKGTF